MDKNLIKVINEEVSKLDYLSIDEIKNDDVRGEILNSREFQTKLVTDIVNQNNQTISDWKEEYSQVDDVEDDGWGTDTIKYLYKYYNFKYHYNEHIFNLNLEIIGEDLPVVTTGTNIPATQLQPAEYPEAESVDYSDIQVTIGDDEERDAINTKWLDDNKQVKAKLANSLLGPLPSVGKSGDYMYRPMP